MNIEEKRSGADIFLSILEKGKILFNLQNASEYLR